MNYLSAISLIQYAHFHGSSADEESAAMMAAHYKFPDPKVLSKVNCLEPWLFAENRAPSIQKLEYYHKVWRLLYHFNHIILPPRASSFWQLKLVTPSFSTLEVTVVIRSLDGLETDETHVLGKDDIEGKNYRLLRSHVRSANDTSSQTLKNENGKRPCSADKDSPSKSPEPDFRNAEAFGSTQRDNDRLTPRSSSIINRPITPRVSSPGRLKTHLEAKYLREEQKGNEKIQKDNVDQEEDGNGGNRRNGQHGEDKEDGAESNQSKESSSDQSLMNVGDMPLSTSLSTSDQAVYIHHAFPAAWQTFNHYSASAAVAPWSDSTSCYRSEAVPDLRKLLHFSIQHLS